MLFEQCYSDVKILWNHIRDTVADNLSSTGKQLSATNRLFGKVNSVKREINDLICFSISKIKCCVLVIRIECDPISKEYQPITLRRL